VTTRPCSSPDCTRRAAQRGLCRPCYDTRASAGTLPAAESYGAPTLPDLGVLGLSYRQLDHWTRKGWVRADDPTPGSGKRRTWDDHELAIAARMVRLIDAGFVVGKAAEIARWRTGYDTFLALGDGIHLLIYENQPTEAAS
jgi:hypothetical protein